MALLYMLGQYPASVIAANYGYYETRTEHGSSLSACMYSLCACAINRPDVAYPLFLKSAEADIQGGGKQWAGLVYKRMPFCLRQTRFNLQKETNLHIVFENLCSCSRCTCEKYVLH